MRKIYSLLFHVLCQMPDKLLHALPVGANRFYFSALWFVAHRA